MDLSEIKERSEELGRELTCLVKKFITETGINSVDIIQQTIDANDSITGKEELIEIKLKLTV